MSTVHARLAPSLRAGVIGAGPMGLCLSALLGQVAPVVMVVREIERAAWIRERGVRVVGLLQGCSGPKVVPGIARLVESAPLDVVFVATKTTAIDAVAEELRPVLTGLATDDGPPYVVSFQNGIDPGRTLVERLEHPRVLRMVLNFGAIPVDLATAEVTLNNPPHFLGSPDPELERFSESLAGALTAAGLRTHATDQIERQVWEKGVLNASMNPVAALTDSSLGEVLDSPARAIVARLMHEAVAVAEAAGMGLDMNDVDRMWQVLEAARAHTPSMVGDIRMGRPSEIGQLNRQVIAHAARVGVPVPSHELITSLIDAFDWRVFRREQPACAGKHDPFAPGRGLKEATS